MTLTPERRAAAAGTERVVVPLGHQRRPEAQTAPAPDAQRASPDDRPDLAEGVDLVGEYEGSGYVEPHYLARRGNGALVQLSRLLYLVADAADGASDLDRIADHVSGEFGRPVSAENVETLVEKLRRLGVLAAADGTSPEVTKSDPLLGLKMRTALIPAERTRSVVRIFRPLFWPVLVAAVAAALLAFDVWLFFVHGIGESLRSSAQQPLVFLLVAGLVVFSAAFHELGHAAGCAYGGARPGQMGAGVYVAWPAFYTDVTDAYRLGRGGRLRTDLGGVYFNAIVVLALAGCFAATGFEPFLLVCFILQVQIVQQLLPLLRLDGYYVLADAVGVPDLFRRIGPILRSAIPFRSRPAEVKELKPHVRAVVTAWVLTVVPLLLANLVYLLLSAPRIVATGWDTGARLWGQLSAAPAVPQAAMAVIQLVFLGIPFLGMSFLFLRLGKRVAVGSWGWSRGRPARRVGVVLGTAGVLTALAVAWWPDVRWSPYRAGEDGTLQQTVFDVRAVGRGEPLLRTPAQAQTPLPAVEGGGSGVTAPDFGVEDDGSPVAPDLAEPSSTASTEPTPTTTPTEDPSPTADVEETDLPSESASPTETAPTSSPTPTEEATTSPSSTTTPSPTSTTIE